MSLREPESGATGPAVRSEPTMATAALRAAEAIRRFIEAVQALDVRIVRARTRSVVHAQRRRRHR